MNQPARTRKTERVPPWLLRLSGGAICMLALTLAGCQSFRPLQESAHQRFMAARQWTQGGLEALHNGRLAAAKTCFSNATVTNPNDQFARASLARTMMQEGNVPQAIDHMQKAVQLAGNDLDLIVELGQMYLDSGDQVSARQQADRVLGSDPRFGPALVLRGKTELAQGEFESALADFQRAAGLVSDRSEVQFLIVETYQRLNQPLRALSAVEQLLAQHHPDEQPERALIAKSDVLLELKQIAPAISLLERASRRKNASSQVFLHLSQAQYLSGQPSQARMTLNRAKMAFPEDRAVADLLARIQPHQEGVALQSSNR